MNIVSLYPPRFSNPLKAVLVLMLFSGVCLSQDLRVRLKSASVASSEIELQKIESASPRSEEAALAKLLRGYLRLQAKDYNAALLALDETVIMRQSKLGDYALYYRAQALQGANRIEEAEQAYARVANTYPSSNLARTSVLQAAGSAMGRGAYQAVISYVEKQAAANDGTALKLKANALEKMGKLEDAAAVWRKMYFEAPQSPEAGDVSNKLTALGAAPAVTGATAQMMRARADKLYQANLWVIAGQAYEQLVRSFPMAADPEAYLRGGISYYKAKSYQLALNLLINVRSRSTKDQADAIYYRGLCYRALRQDTPAMQALSDLRRVAPGSVQLGDLLYNIGKAYETSQPATASTYYEQLFREAPRAEQGDVAHFWRAWRAHEANDFATAYRLFIEHLAEYGEVTENRGKAAFWGALDAERAGDKARALTMYKALLLRYGAGWYGYNAERHIAELTRQGVKELAPESDAVLSRAVAKLQINPPVVETMNPADAERLEKAGSLVLINQAQSALNELEAARNRAANSPRINLQIAQIYRARNENVSAVNVLKRAYPDYGQALLPEMPRAAWDVFYPLGWWSTIKEEAKRNNIDPYLIAGLIRQETIFNPQAVSRANAIGLMQLLPSTGRSVAKRYSLGGGAISSADLFNPILNIQLGTAYVAEQIRQFGRFEYVAAAYNGGPSRVSRWLRELPAGEIEEWVDSIPLSETRAYVQGVYRNARQYKRLYDEQGRFRPEVGDGN
ncbi:MAG: transglycosylase SLT domain-containing protein [Blastocatellia bacterium]|nr:transglycosylase SLT domain-containing protein [Blastocatellia bacterium]